MTFNLEVLRLPLRAALCAIFLLSENLQGTTFAQTFTDYNLNEEILDRLERDYIVDLGLSELSEENRNIYLNLSPEDLLATLKVDEGTQYVTPEELEALSADDRTDIKPPIFEIQDSIAILKYSEFNSFAAQDTRNFFAQRETTKIDLKGVIIDLRNNSGGIFNEITDIADLFLKDTLIFSIVARDGKDTEHLNANRLNVIWGNPIIILTDETTASGAAILARTLQSNGRAKVYGQPSADIAYIQSVFPLGYGREGALKISTHRIVFLEGETGSNSKVTPDVYIKEDLLGRAIEELLTGHVK